MYSVELNLRVEADSYEELSAKLKELDKDGIKVGNWEYMELEENTLLRENTHVGKVVQFKDKSGTKTGVITKVNPKKIVVCIGNGMEYNCTPEGLIDVKPEEFKEEDLRIGRPEDFYTYSGFIGYTLNDGSLVACFENRGKYDLILVDTNGGTSGKLYGGIPERDLNRYIKFTK